MAKLRVYWHFIKITHVLKFLFCIVRCVVCYNHQMRASFLTSFSVMNSPLFVLPALVARLIIDNALFMFKLLQLLFRKMFAGSNKE